MQKKILIVTHHFYPEINPRAFRATELTKELIVKGYWVNVVYGEAKLTIDNKTLTKYINSHSNCYKVQSPPMKSATTEESCLKKIFRFFFAEKLMFTRLKWTFNAIKHFNGHTAIISIGTPFYVHLATALAVPTKKRKYVMICDNGDPFYNYNKLDKAFYWGWIQKYVFSKFDFICTPTSNAINYYAQYTDKNKIRVIPQGYNFTSVSIAEYKKNPIPTFAFAGRFYKDIRNPEPLLQFLANLQEQFQFLIFAPQAGDVYQNILLSYERRLGNKLILCGMLPREQCIYELSKVDFLVNLENTLSVQVPSKMVDYALSRRPIISFKHTDIPYKKLREWIKGDYIDPLKIDISPFDIKNVSKQFESLFDRKVD